MPFARREFWIQFSIEIKSKGFAYLSAFKFVVFEMFDYFESACAWGFMFIAARTRIIYIALVAKRSKSLLQSSGYQ